jgi:hypothetical protein
MKGLDPIWLTVIATIVAIDNWIGGGKVDLHHVFPELWIPWIVGWAGFLGGILGFVVAALTAIVSSKPGVLISTPVAVAKQIVLLAIILGSLFAFSGRAHAQDIFHLGQKSKVTRAAKPAAAAPSLQDAVQDVLTKLQNVHADAISGTIAALKEADADAGTVIVQANGSTPAQVKDPISHACYPAEIQYLQSLPTAQAITAPAPYNLIVLFQYKRDFVNLLLSGQLVPTYLKLGCSALLGNEAAILAATLGAVGIGAATIAPITAFATTLGAGAVAFPALLALPK